MNIKTKHLHYINIAILIYSKFFYHSIFSIVGFNFTLSDLSLSLMLAFLIKKNVSLDKFYLFIISFTFIVFLSFSLGSMIQGTSLFNGTVIYIKRWISLIAIPLYIKDYFDIKDTRIIVNLIIGNVLIFTIINWNNMISSANISRYSDTFNPNVLGMVMSIILVFIMNVEIKGINKNIYVIIGIISTIIIIVVSSRGAILALLPVVLLSIFYKRKLTTKSILKIIVSISIFIISIQTLMDSVKKVFPYSYSRIFNTFTAGILNDRSALSRFSTQGIIIEEMSNNLSLFLFGTGFGNGNMFSVFSRHGYIINTADSMYINIYAWSGIIGFIAFFSIIIMILLRLQSNPRNVLKKTMIMVTILLILGGISQDTFTEPTIGAIYFILFGLYEIQNKKSED